MWKEGQSLGRGSFGEVVRAMNIKNGNIFAVKKLNFISPTKGINHEVL
jgi:serine/threonine protein kinase